MSASAWFDDRARSRPVTTAEGRFPAYVAPACTRDRPVVVVLHEVFGVNADQRATCDELALAGFNAICPELFWRQAPHVDLSVTETDDWERGLALYGAFDLDAGVRDVAATVETARAIPGTSGRVGVMGFCLGGLLTFLVAARTRVDAAVAFHGSRTEEFLGETRRIDAPLQMHLAEADEFMPKAAQRSITDALSGERRFEVFSYAGCRHAFSRHGGIHYDADAARLSRGRTLAFLERHLAG